MKNKKINIIIIILIVIILLAYYVFGQEYRYAKINSNRLFDYELPKKTKLIEKDFDYGVLYGGGPSGSGGYPTVVGYMKLSSELSEKDIFNYYEQVDFEIFFEGSEILKKNNEGKEWYEDNKISNTKLSDEKNEDNPINFIVQDRTEFTYPFFIDFY